MDVMLPSSERPAISPVPPPYTSTNTNSDDLSGNPRGLGGRLRKGWVRLWGSARYDRLNGSLDIARVEIERRYDPPAHEGSNRPPGLGQQLAEGQPEPGAVLPANGWRKAAIDLLAQGRAALALGKIDQGWRLLHAARRMEIFGLEKGELCALTKSLRAESDGKLKEWRKKANKDNLIPDLPTAAQLWQAALIRDEHYDNQGYKDQLIRTQILFLAVVLAAVIAGIMGLAYTGRLPSGMAVPAMASSITSPAAATTTSVTGTVPTPAPTTKPGEDRTPATPPTTGTADADKQAPIIPFFGLLAVMLFGNLGSTVSAILRVSDIKSSARVPEITSAVRVTFIRIFMGGASAVVIYLAMQSQLTDIFTEQVASTMKSLMWQTTYVISFIAGFTERLVLRAVEYVAGKPMSAESKTA